MPEHTKRVGLGLILVSLTLTLGAGLLVKAPCASGQWSGDIQYTRLCYSDIIPLYGTEHLQGSRLPYLNPCPTGSDQCDEYPVVTMYAMRLAAWPSNSYGSFFGWNAVMLGAAAVIVVVALYKMAGQRALYFALAPTLLIYGFVNWDLLAVALAAAGTLAFLTRRDGTAGILLGLGTAAKLYPLLLVVPFVAQRFGEKDPDGGIRLSWGAAGAWLAVNVPFFLASSSSWSNFFRFNSNRQPDFDSLWYIGCHQFTGNNGCVSTPLVNVLSLAAFVGGAVLVWQLRARRDGAFPRWTLGFPLIVLFLLTNKVYSPQYGLWLLPWFALAFPGLGSGATYGLFALFQATDVAVFVTRFSWFATLDGKPGPPFGAFEVAVLLRALVLVVALVVWIRQSRSLDRAEERAEEPAVPAGASRAAAVA